MRWLFALACTVCLLAVGQAQAKIYDGHHDVVYHRGPVLRNLKVYNVLWAKGPSWNNVNPSLSQSRIDDLTRRVLATQYLRGLEQYRADGSAVLDGSYQGFHNRLNCKPRTPGKTVTLAGVGGYLRCNIANPQHHLPRPNGHRIYVVYVPQGTQIREITKTRSCADYGGIHKFKTWLPNMIYYIVIPLRCYYTDPNIVGDVINVFSHELVEVMTDPLWPGGWYEGRIPKELLFVKKGEVADICDAEGAPSLQLDGVGSLNAYWSKHDNSCVAGDAGPLFVMSRSVSVSGKTVSVHITMHHAGPGTYHATRLGLITSSRPRPLGRFKDFGADSNVSVKSDGDFHYKASAGFFTSGTYRFAMAVQRSSSGTAWEHSAGWTESPDLCIRLVSGHSPHVC